MAQNKLSDLRNHMFNVIEELINPEEGSKMDINKAKAIASCGAVIVNAAKLELEAVKIADKMNGVFPQNSFFQLNEGGK